MIRRLLIAVLVTLAVGHVGAARETAPYASGGGDGGGSIPPLSGPVSSTHGPTLGTPPGRVVILMAEAGPRRPSRGRRVLVRDDTRVVAQGMIPVGQPAVLPIPLRPGLTLDILGTDALGIPVRDGQAVQVLLGDVDAP